MSSKSLADQNMVVCNTEQAAELLKLAFDAKRPVMLWGSPGIGKSGLLKTIAKDTGRGMIDYRLLLKDISDLKGIPYVADGKMDMYYDPNLPNDKLDANDRRILVFEELNAAPPTIQAATYQIILDRYCGDMKIPDGVDIVACGNLETDKGVTFNMPTPLRNRLLHILVEHDPQAWENWAFRAKVHKNVLAYIMNNKSRLYQFDPSTGEKAFATPRSWEMVSDLLYAAERADQFDNREVLRGAIGSAVGEGNAVEFLRYIEVSDKLPSAEDIIAGKLKGKKLATDDISAHYTLGIELIYEFDRLSSKLDESEDMDASLNEQFANAFDFMEEHFTEELIYLTLHKMLNDSSTANYIDLDSSIDSFDRFMESYSDLISNT